MKYFPKKLTITWIRNSYKSGKLTPMELIKEIMRRVESNDYRNIWIAKPSMEFIKPYIDNLAIKDIEKCPLWGIPFAIKDNIDVKGLITTAGCEEYGYLAKESAFVVKKLIDAGAIPLGKTNLDQFATGLVGTRSPYGEVHNALNEELISGGSSSGSAVSVALGEVAFALGTDTAGSGRVPAALNALVGYKPSLGAWSTNGVVPACASLDCVTVFANNLEEVEVVNSVARGFDNKCCWSKEYDDIVKKMPKKICLPKEDLEFFGQYKEIYKVKWYEALERIVSLGIEINYIDYSIFQEAASILYDGPWVAERWKDLGDFVKSNSGAVFPVTKEVLQSGGKAENTAVKVFEAMHKLQQYKMIVKDLLKDSVIIMPTVGGTFTRDEVRENPIETNSLMGKYTNHCNLLNMCAVAVPENTDDTVLPFGITIFGLAKDEGLILKTAEEFLEKESVKLAVCGLHMEDMELESQLIELDAELIGTTKTSKDYKLIKLNTAPEKPGLIRVKNNGKAIEVQVYRISKSKLGKFLTNITAPLGIGDIELESGEIVKGFICEGYVEKESEDISDYESFKKYKNR
ncbi:allophanate hydrolase [Clostridium bornimense]|uniref:Allophanate hydrolase n=1 Tax=Clostridium bornimense TaxID=1216932 RepID=W6S0K2_9CLOT|nr:allophanate hydrolase [Clostridium bornimense]CDM70288.1 allophanate hydrolase [Clostridium bornimense]